MDTPGAAGQYWAEALAGWRIPEEILARAPQSPWIHPVELFTVDDAVPDSPSHALAREALGTGGSVLDIGCGGGRAAFAGLLPRRQSGRQPGLDQDGERVVRRRPVGALQVPEVLPERGHRRERMPLRQIR